MANSYINIVTFILTTVFYYMVLKPPLTYDALIDAKKYEEYSKNNYLYLFNALQVRMARGLQLSV